MSTAGIKEQVQKADELLTNGQAQADQRQKRKARLRSVRRVAFATACLLIGICVYSVLDPTIVSSASSFLSRAKLWVGNVLQVNAAVDAPPPDTGFYSIEVPAVHYNCQTIEEIHATFGLAVYEPTQIPSSMKLGNIEADIVDGDLISFRYRYEADEKNLVLFTIQPLGTVSPQMNFPDHAFKHTAPAGEFTVNKAVSNGWHTVMLTGESIVDIWGTLDQDAFLNMLDTLRIVN